RRQEHLAGRERRAVALPRHERLPWTAGRDLPGDPAPPGVSGGVADPRDHASALRARWLRLVPRTAAWQGVKGGWERRRPPAGSQRGQRRVRRGETEGSVMR